MRKIPLDRVTDELRPCVTFEGRGFALVDMECVRLRREQARWDHWRVVNEEYYQEADVPIPPPVPSRKPCGCGGKRAQENGSSSLSVAPPSDAVGGQLL